MNYIEVKIYIYTSAGIAQINWAFDIFYKRQRKFIKEKQRWKGQVYKKIKNKIK